MTMTKTTSKVLAVMFVAMLLMLLPAITDADAPARFGHFVEIRHDQYLGPTGEMMYEYMMYDRTTMIVYIYTTDGKNMLSITPYMMRDFYGQITCGLYNGETGGIDPAELSFFVEEDEVWEIRGQR